MNNSSGLSGAISAFLFYRAFATAPFCLLGCLVAGAAFYLRERGKPLDPDPQAPHFPEGVTLSDSIRLMRENQSLGVDLFTGRRESLKPEPQESVRPLSSKERLQLHLQAMAEGGPQDSPYSLKS
jgi:hypothetical protein